MLTVFSLVGRNACARLVFGWRCIPPLFGARLPRSSLLFFLSGFLLVVGVYKEAPTCREGAVAGSKTR